MVVVYTVNPAHTEGVLGMSPLTLKEMLEVEGTQGIKSITSPELTHLSGSDNDVSHTQLQALIYFTEQLN